MKPTCAFCRDEATTSLTVNAVVNDPDLPEVKGTAVRVDVDVCALHFALLADRRNTTEDMS